MNDRDILGAIEHVRILAAQEAERILRKAVEELSGGDLRDVEVAIRQQILCLGGKLLEQALAVQGAGYEGSRRACSCGKRQKFVSYRWKQVATLLSDMSVKRAYYHCPDCGEGAIPLDRRWDVVDTGFSPAYREAIAWLAAEAPFERSRELLEKLCGARVSKERVEEIAESLGREVGACSQTGSLTAPWPEAQEPQDLYVEMDGTTVPLKTEWKEVKVGSVFRACVDSDGKPVRGTTLYMGRLTDAETFGSELYRKVEEVHPWAFRRLVLLGDGAPWIWNQAELHFPTAIQIVDWYHAKERLWEVARAVYGDDSPRVPAWAKDRETELWGGNVEAVIEALLLLNPRRRKGQDAARKATHYFQTHKERMRYDRFRKQGLFIGSGVVEGSCKHVVGDRFKKAGMHWSKSGVDRTLDLRLCILNNQWEQFWQWHRSTLKMAA